MSWRIVVVVHSRSPQKNTDKDKMYIPGLPPDIYSFLEFVFTVFFVSLGFVYLLQSTNSNHYVDRIVTNFDRNGYYDDRRRHRDTDIDKDTDTDTDRDHQMPLALIQKFCLVCGDWSYSRCSRCKVARYCSETCQIKHWRAGHKLECKEYRSPSNIGSARTVSSEGLVDGTPTKTTQPSKRDSRKEHRSIGECPICLTAIRTYKHSRPSLSCETCKQKCHSPCISMWFSTSKKSSCPCCLCPFQSGGTTVQSSSSSK